MDRRKYTEKEIKSNKNRIKQFFTKEGVTVEEVAKQVHSRHPLASPNGDNLSRKLNNGTLKSIEEIEIADALGYDVIWVKRKN